MYKTLDLESIIGWLAKLIPSNIFKMYKMGEVSIAIFTEGSTKNLPKFQSHSTLASKIKHSLVIITCLTGNADDNHIHLAQNRVGTSFSPNKQHQNPWESVKWKCFVTEDSDNLWFINVYDMYQCNPKGVVESSNLVYAVIWGYWASLLSRAPKAIIFNCSLQYV